MIDIYSLAALVDEQGNIVITSDTTSLDVKLPKMSYARKLSSMYGGTYRIVTLVSHYDDYQYLVWTTSADYVKRVLEEVLPYLVIKAEQARIAIEYQSHLSCSPYQGRSGVPEEELYQREQLIRQMADAKARVRATRGELPRRTIKSWEDD